MRCTTFSSLRMIVKAFWISALHCIEATASTFKDGSFTHNVLPSGSGLTVASLCLDAPIAGAVRDAPRGPSPMHAVADKDENGIIYFSWSEDLPFGLSEDEGRIHMVKARIGNNERADILRKTSFTGFVTAGGMDITEDGLLGTLCAKYVPRWVESFEQWCPDITEPWKLSKAPMMLAVCEVDTKTMQPHGTPWRIGKQFKRDVPPWLGYTAGEWGNYPW